MKKVLFSILCMAVSYGAFAQKSEITEAEKAWNLYTTIGSSQPLAKQLEALNKGLEHTDKATTHEKSKALPKGWSTRALIASQIAYVDTVDAANSAAKVKIAEDALAQVKTLDTKNEEKDNVENASKNITAAITNTALRAYNKKDYETALKGFDGLLVRNPNDTSMYVNAGLTAKSIKKYPEAIGYFKKAIALNSKDSKVLYQDAINMTLTELKDTTAGLAMLDEAIAKFPEDGDLLGVQTDIYINKGDIEKSQASLNKLLTKEPGKPVYNFLLGNTYFKQAQDLQEKRNKVDQIKKKAEFEALTKKMNTLIDQSIPFYNKALETDPKYIPSLEALKIIYAFKSDSQKYEEMSKRLKEAEASAPKN